MRTGGAGAHAAGRRDRRRSALAVACLVGALLFVPAARAQTMYTVTTGGDDPSGPAPCTGGGGGFTCTTLFDAVSASNSAGGSNTIGFAASVSAVTISDLMADAGSALVLGARVLTVTSSGPASAAGVISGAGSSLVMAGAGTLTLGGANTFTGATTVSAGTLSIAADNNLGAAANPLTLDAGTALTLTGSFTFDHPVTISGDPIFDVASGQNVVVSSVIADGAAAGSVVKTGAGTLTLTAADTYTGATTIGGGTLVLGPGGSIANSLGVSLTAAGAIFDIAAAGNQTIQGLAGIAGTTVNLGANTLTDFSAASTSFAGAIIGTGGLVKSGTGTLTLTGANTYSGGTTVAQGMLIGNATSLQGTIIDNATVEFDQTTLGTYAGTLGGNGTLLVEGAGGLALTGNSSAFAGDTVVAGGALIVGSAANPGASLGGSVTVENSGLLAGRGTIGGALSNSSGVVIPVTTAGNTLTVDGGYTQGSAGTLGIGVVPATNDRLTVIGRASLAGTLDAVFAPGGYVPFSRFTVLTAAGGVGGSFAQLTGSLPILPVTIAYLPNAVQLQLGGFTGATDDEQAVAGVLNAVFPTATYPDATSDFATVLAQAVNLPPAQMQQSLSSFGGEIYGNLAQVSLQDRRLFLGAMDERIRLLGNGSPAAAVLGDAGGGIQGAWGSGVNAWQLAALGNAVDDPIGDLISDMSDDVVNDPVGLAARAAAPQVINDPVGLAVGNPAAGGGTVGDPVGFAASRAALVPKSTGFWARGFGQFGSIGNSAGALGSNYTTGGGAIGADLISSRDSLFGIAVSGGQSSVSLNTNPENGTISFVQVGVYGAKRLGGGIAFDGAAIYAHDYYNVTRGIVLPGAGRVATSSHGGNDGVLDIGVSRPYFAGGWQFTPRLGLSYFHIGQSAFSESGANSLDLAVQPDDLNALFTRVGAAICAPMVLNDVHILPEFRAAWLHNLLADQSQYTAGFIGSGAASFIENGPTVGRDAADLGAGLSFLIPQRAIPVRMTGFLQYDSSLAAHATANAVAAGLRVRW